jgi:hypothetical protein
MATSSHSQLGPVYVFADRAGWVYAVASGTSTADALLDRMRSILMGVYTETVDPLRLFVDLGAHLVDVGFVSPQQIMDAVRDAEG